MAVEGVGRPADVPAERRVFEFTGKAGEYFGIWIVNILLTIVTLGIYSAWAKVRRKRYFYGNTRLDGNGFEYHARGGQILKGRLIVLAAFIVYNVTIRFYPIAGLAVLLVLLAATPWLLARAIRFNARVTSYRNVRFDFSGGYRGAAFAFFLGGFVAFATLGVLAPLASRWMARYVYGNLRYGNRAFSSVPPLGALYGVWVLPAVLAVAMLAIVGGVFAAAMFLAMRDPAAMGLAGEAGASGASISVLHVALALAYLGLIALYVVVWHLYSAGVRNVVYGATVMEGGHRLESTMPRWCYAWVSVTNVLVTILTLGLMRPWAAVRMARFSAAHTAVLFAGPVGEVLSAIEADGSAVGSEYVDFEGIDIGI